MNLDRDARAAQATAEAKTCLAARESTVAVCDNSVLVSKKEKKKAEFETATGWRTNTPKRRKYRVRKKKINVTASQKKKKTPRSEYIHALVTISLSLCSAELKDVGYMAALVVAAGWHHRTLRVCTLLVF